MLALSVLNACAALRLGDSEAGLLLEDLMAGEGDSRLKARTLAPVKREIRFRAVGQTLRADLYVPREAARAGITLLPGLAPAGKDDPRLSALARSLARVGFNVLIPDIPGFRALAIHAADVDVVARAVLALKQRPEMRPGRPAGIGAFSFAVGPAVLAALRPELVEEVKFLVGIGGYYDLRRLLAYYTTGAQRRAAHEPTPYDQGKWIFALGVADRLSVPDRLIIEALARQAIRAEAVQPLAPEGIELSPAGAALLELLSNTTPARVPTLLERLPQRLRDEMRALNPAESNLSNLRARLLLLHGRNDNVIPYTESVALAAAAAPGQARLFLIEGLAHVDLKPAWSDVEPLLALANALLDERHRK